MEPITYKKLSMIKLFLGILFLLIFIVLYNQGTEAKFVAAIFFIFALYLLAASMFHFGRYKKHLEKAAQKN